MAQVYKMMLGTSGKQWEQLTVKDDGTMTMTFHGTDREICHEVTENADGWLCYPGAMYPGLKSGKWQLMEDGRGLKADVVETNTNCTNYTNEVAESETTTDKTDFTDLESEHVYTDNAKLEQLRAENQRLQEQIAQMANQPRPRRQRKPRVERQEPLTVNPDCNATLSEREPLTVNHQTSSTLKAVGMVAAATVALLVIYETGLLIPLGLIGLATGGILK